MKAKVNYTNLPYKITLTAYGDTIEFIKTDKKQIKYYGKTEKSNESLWRNFKLEKNQVYYQSEFACGVIVDANKMATISYDGTEWCGQKIDNFDFEKKELIKKLNKFLKNTNYEFFLCGSFEIPAEQLEPNDDLYVEFINKIDRECYVDWCFEDFNEAELKDKVDYMVLGHGELH